MEYTIFASTNNGTHFSMNADREVVLAEIGKFWSTVDYFGGGYCLVLDDQGDVIHHYRSTDGMNFDNRIDMM